MSEKVWKMRAEIVHNRNGFSLIPDGGDEFIFGDIEASTNKKHGFKDGDKVEVTLRKLKK